MTIESCKAVEMVYPSFYEKLVYLEQLSQELRPGSDQYRESGGQSHAIINSIQFSTDIGQAYNTEQYNGQMSNFLAEAINSYLSTITPVMHALEQDMLLRLEGQEEGNAFLPVVVEMVGFENKDSTHPFWGVFASIEPDFSIKNEQGNSKAYIRNAIPSVEAIHNSDAKAIIKELHACRRVIGDEITDLVAVNGLGTNKFQQRMLSPQLKTHPLALDYQAFLSSDERERVHTQNTAIVEEYKMLHRMRDKSRMLPAESGQNNMADSDGAGLMPVIDQEHQEAMKYVQTMLDERERMGLPLLEDEELVGLLDTVVFGGTTQIPL